ncbi:hypothetical protein ABIA26_001723 [Sinorhizobium fredii]
MKPMRQIEVAQLMTTMNRFSVSYANSLVAATPEAMLVRPNKLTRGLSQEQVALMETEAANLDREFKTIEQDYGADHLVLVLTTGYVAQLIGNARVVGYLTQKFPEILAEFQKITEARKVA